MSLNYFQIHKDAFPEELLSCEKEMRNPHPFELLVSEYFNHSIMDTKLSWKQEICLRVESEQSDVERKML